MPTLRDGTVVPHHLGVSRPSGTVPSAMVFGNAALRIGEVVEVVHADDPKSVTKRFTEYSVLVQHRDGAGVGAAVTYGHCVVASLYGGEADFDTYTLRARSRDDLQSDAGDGSKVLLLCVNGDINSAFIVAGARGSEAPQDPGTQGGHRAAREFNGVRQEIDRTGTWAVTVKGATAANGDLAPGVDPDSGGASLELESGGDARLAHGEQVFEVLHGSKKVRAAGTGGVELDAGSSEIVATARRVRLGSPGASEALVRGTTQRRAEAQRDRDAISALSSATAAVGTTGSLAAAAAAQIAAVAVLHATPVTGPVQAAPALAGVAATVGSMAATLAQVAEALGRVAAAFVQYEAGAASYLSAKNTTD